MSDVDDHQATPDGTAGGDSQEPRICTFCGDVVMFCSCMIADSVATHHIPPNPPD